MQYTSGFKYRCEEIRRREDLIYLYLVVSSLGVKIHSPGKVHEGEVSVSQFLIDFTHEEVDEALAGDELLQLLQLLERLEMAVGGEEDRGFMELAERILRITANCHIQSD